MGFQLNADQVTGFLDNDLRDGTDFWENPGS
jgi:hypothetical protein